MWMDSFRHFVRRIRPRRQCKCGNVKPRFVVRQNVVKTMNEYDQVNSHGLNENKSLRREGDTLNRLQTHAEHTGRRSTVMRCIYIYVSSQPFPAHQPLLHSFILELITHLSWILCFDRPWPPRPRSCCCSSVHAWRQRKCDNVKPFCRQSLMNEDLLVNSRVLKQSKVFEARGARWIDLETMLIEHTSVEVADGEQLYMEHRLNHFPHTNLSHGRLHIDKPLFSDHLLDRSTSSFERSWPPRPRSCCCSSCWFRAACSLSRRREQWRETSGGGSRAACCWGLCNKARCRHRDLRVAPTTLNPRPALFARDAMRW